MHSRENFFELVDLQNNNSNNVQHQDQSLLTQVFKSILQHTISAFVKSKKATRFLNFNSECKKYANISYI